MFTYCHEECDRQRTNCINRNDYTLPFGERDRGPAALRTVRVDVDDQDIIAVAIGGAHTLAVSKFGEVYSFGRGREGQLGHGPGRRGRLSVPSKKPGGTTRTCMGVMIALCHIGVLITALPIPYTVGMNPGPPSPPAWKIQGLVDATVVAVACGAHHSLAITSSGRLYQWGLVHQDVATSSTSSPGSEPVDAIDAEYLMAMLGVVGLQRNSLVYQVVSSSAVQWVSANDLSSGISLCLPVPNLVTSLRGKQVVSVSAGHNHSVVVTAAGQAFASGTNDCGQLGLGHRMHTGKFRPVRGLDTVIVLEVSCGEQHNLARVLPQEGCRVGPSSTWTEDGMGADVYVWGGGRLGQLGLGNRTECLIPTLLETMRGVGGGVISVGSGVNHSACITRDGSLYSFGHAEYNQQGIVVIGGADLQGHHYRVPQLVPGMSRRALASVECGCNFTLVLDKEGAVYSFGWNTGGVLGRGWEEASPRSIRGLPTVVGVVAGTGHSAALTHEGPSTGRHFESVLKSGVHADVVLRAGGGSGGGAPCHLCIISARCPSLAGYIRAALGKDLDVFPAPVSPADGDPQVVELSYCNASDESVELLLQYLYTDSVDEVIEKESMGCLGSLAQELLLPRYGLQHTQRELEARVAVPNSTFLEDMGRLAGRHDHFDVTLAIPSLGWTFPCHRAILCRVEYCRALLMGGFREGLSNTVNLDGFTEEGLTKSEAMEAVIRFIYTNSDTVLLGMDPSVVMEVVICAGLMGLSHLLLACERELRHHVDSGLNTDHLIEFAKEYGLPKLAALCFEISSQSMRTDIPALS